MISEANRLTGLFERISKILGDRACSEYRIEGMSFLRCKLVLYYDDAVEIWEFKYEPDGPYKVVDHYTFDNRVQHKRY